MAHDLNVVKCAVVSFTHLKKKVISYNSSQYISGNNSSLVSLGSIIAVVIIEDKLGGTALNLFNVRSVFYEIWSP